MVKRERKKKLLLKLIESFYFKFRIDKIDETKNI